MAFHRRGLFRRLLLSLWPAAGVRFAEAQTPPAEAPKPGRAGGYIRPGTIEVVHKKFDLVVVGGGMAGICAAISAARNGVRTALVHERSMLGGNSASEVRLYPEDSTNHNIWCKELGILDEIHVEERVRNHEPYAEGQTNCHWDMVLYEWVLREKNISMFLNTSMREVEMQDPSHILAIHAVQLGTERDFIFEAPLFVDATGDGVLGYRAGAEIRWGKEARAEFGEPAAPEKPSQALMGSTLFFRARDTGKPIAFHKPAWAPEFNTEDDLLHRGHTRIEAGYWWIEVGDPMHWIRDNEEIKHEAIRQMMGVWDHLKNKCERRKETENYSLDFVGFWPYKREARRIIGDYILRQRDVQAPVPHRDDVAFGCWDVDVHAPGGILRRDKPTYPSLGMDEIWEATGTVPYGIPLGSCYSRNIGNLLVAGRPISCSYVGFSSTRVLRTGAAVGQAVGTAVAFCRKYNCDPRTVSRQHASDLQRLLLRQDGFIPGVENQDPLDLARGARVSASSEAPMIFPESLSDTFRPLKFPLAQLFPVSSDRIEAVELLLQSELPESARLTIGLRKAERVYDLRGSEDVATGSANVPPGYRGYVRFSLNARVTPGSLYYLHLPAHRGIGWALHADEKGQPSTIPVGSTAADMPGPSRWRPLCGSRSFCMRVSPQQRPFGAQNVVRGTNRPDKWTNIFISDQEQALPAWIELELPRPEKFTTVQVTFDTDVNRLCRNPLFRYPDCVKRYEIAIREGAGWRTVAQSDDNYLRRRVHTFPAVTSDRLRIQVLETNGAKAARIYEVRIYSEMRESAWQEKA